MITSKSRLQAEELVKLSNYFGAAGLYLPQRFGVFRLAFIGTQESLRSIHAGSANFAGFQRKANCLSGWARRRTHDMQVSNAIVDLLRDGMQINPKQRVVLLSGRGLFFPPNKVFVEEGGHATSFREFVVSLLCHLGTPLPSCDEGSCKDRPNAANRLNPCWPHLPSILVHVDAHGVKPDCIRQAYASNDGSSEPSHRLPVNRPHLTSPVLNAEIVCGGIA